MFRMWNLFFIIILINSSIVPGPGLPYGDSKTAGKSETIESELAHFIVKGEFNKVKNIVQESNIDLNRSFQGQSMLWIAIYSYLSLFTSDLKIIKFLLENGANINGLTRLHFNDLKMPHTSLHNIISQAMVEHSIFYKVTIDKIKNIIELLLGYGATIDSDIIELVQDDEILPILRDHQELEKQAMINPTSELLIKAVESANPYIVKLIIEANPELLDYANFLLIIKDYPFLESFLKKTLSRAKFRKGAKDMHLPIELIMRIEKFGALS